MAKPLLFLDFDGTLFDTNRFIHWVDSWLAETQQTPLGQYVAQAVEHYEPLGNGLRLYNHLTHMQQASGQAWAAIEPLLKAALAQQHFCYPDTHASLQTLRPLAKDIRLLTFGREEFQHFKLGHCPFLKNSFVSVHVVQEFKADFLKRDFPKDTGFLVDDHYPMNLAKPWQHIWINRYEPLAAPTRLQDKTWQIHSLEQLPALVHDID